MLGRLDDEISIGGIDLDSCIAANGEPEHWAAGLVSRLNTYTEVSPSGSSLKAFFQYRTADLPALREAMGGVGGKKWALASTENHPPAIELYLDGRFFTVTGQMMERSTKQLRPIPLENLLDIIQVHGPALVAENQSGQPSSADQSRSAVAFRLGLALVRNGASFEEICAALRDDPTAADWTREKGDPNGERELRRIFEKAESQTDENVIELNKTYAFILVGGQPVVLHEDVDPEGRPELNLLTEHAFRSWFRNRSIPTGKKPKPLADHWLSHPNRRQYKKLVFLPGQETPEHYNLWRGFTVEPRQGDWSLFRAHLLDNACNGQPDLFSWVFGWFAAIFQHPTVKTGTSLVIRGHEGTGKTIIGYIIGSLLGDHYLLVSDPRYIVGRFNAHMASLVLLHADEGFWAGDHASEGRLKDLITGNEHLIEYKGKEAIRVRNFVRLFVTGNPDWVVPVSLEGRRFAALTIGEAQMQNSAYFKAIVHQMNNGGREALLYDLLKFDLDTVDLRVVPKTAALLEQKMESLTPEQAWWMDVLHRGSLPYGCDVPSECPAQRLFDQYIVHASKVGVRRKSFETKLGIFLNKVAPSLMKVPGTYKDGMITHEGAIYQFPELSVCRARFDELLHQRVKWDAPEDWTSEGYQSDDPPF